MTTQTSMASPAPETLHSTKHLIRQCRSDEKHIERQTAFKIDALSKVIKYLYYFEKNPNDYSWDPEEAFVLHQLKKEILDSIGLINSIPSLSENHLVTYLLKNKE